MPNPYMGNDKAAELVEYFASERMLRESVHRLHHQALEERRESIRRVEEEVYPPSPRIVRSQEEMQRYLERRVQKEMLRRQQHKAMLERELYPELFSSLQISEEEMQRQLQRLYPAKAASIQRQPRRKRDPITGKPIPSPKESNWPETDPDSGKQTVWLPSYRNDSTTYSVLEQLYAPRPHRPASFDKKRHEERILALSKPRGVIPKPREGSSQIDSARPMFKVPRRVQHLDV